MITRNKCKVNLCTDPCALLGQSLISAKNVTETSDWKYDYLWFISSPDIFLNKSRWSHFTRSSYKEREWASFEFCETVKDKRPDGCVSKCNDAVAQEMKMSKLMRKFKATHAVSFHYVCLFILHDVIVSYLYFTRQPKRSSNKQNDNFGTNWLKNILAKCSFHVAQKATKIFIAQERFAKTKKQQVRNTPTLHYCWIPFNLELWPFCNSFCFFSFFKKG